MKIKATTPCYKFIDASAVEQIAKLREELGEIEEAYQALEGDPMNYKKLVDLYMEIIDLKACCNTFMAQLRACYKDVSTAHAMAHKDAAHQVVIKNMTRGYYLSPEDCEKLAKEGAQT